MDTFYDLLKVPRTANVGEIVAAYHSAKGAFSKDSVATYSLFSGEELQIELAKLEEAYLTLSNVDKKREYDRLLSLKVGAVSNPPPTPEKLVPVKKEETAPETNDIAPEPADGSSVSGEFLKKWRTHRGLSIDDVARITKIPAKFLRSIESEDVKTLPARVYVQGFLRNIAVLYKLDPRNVAVSYMTHIESRLKDIWKE